MWRRPVGRSAGGWRGGEVGEPGQCPYLGGTDGGRADGPRQWMSVCVYCSVWVSGIVACAHRVI